MGFGNSKRSKENKNKKEDKNKKLYSYGKLYNKNTNKIIYEGDLLDNICHGKGKYIFENGDYYIGQFKNGLRDGEGIQYYNNKKIQYEGIWKEDKRNGSGKYYYENGNYFIGFWKNNEKVGLGELYDINKNLIIGGEVSHINTEEKNYSINLNDLILK